MRYLAILLVALVSPALAQNSQPSEYAAGRSDYQAGRFKQAAAHFELALQVDSRSAESQYWLGRSYETLADIATPFGRKYRSLARTHLTAAAELAPGRPEYRSELFEFLLDSGDRRRALALLLASAESDPEYDSMRSRIDQTRRLSDSFNGRITRMFQLVTAWR